MHEGVLFREATERSEALDRRVPRLAFESDVLGAAVSVDGRAVCQIPCAPIRVGPGAHQVLAEAKGYAAFRSAIELEAGASRRVTIALVADAPPPVAAEPAALVPAAIPPPPEPEAPIEQLAPPPAAPASIAQDEGGTLWGKWWLWVGVGVAAAAATGVAIAASSGRGSTPPDELGVSAWRNWEPQ